MRVLVTGSRDWTDNQAVYDALYKAYASADPGEQVIVVNGGATGADTIAGHWADMCGQMQEVHLADWPEHGKAAGPRRNQEMVNAGADICLAFLRNDSRGTNDCIERAKQAGIPVKVWRQEYPT